MRRKLAVAAAGLLAWSLVGCGTGSQAPTPSATGPTETDSASASPTNPPDPSRTPTSKVTFSNVPTSAQPVTPSGELTVTQVRVGDHEEYDRVVVEFAGGSAENLGWRVEYDPDPRTQGQGAPVELPGAETVRLIIFGLTYPPEGGTMPSGLQPGSAQGDITGVYVDPVFEGQAQVFIGLDAQRGFSVSALDSPTRIVVDIDNS